MLKQQCINSTTSECPQVPTEYIRRLFVTVQTILAAIGATPQAPSATATRVSEPAFQVERCDRQFAHNTLGHTSCCHLSKWV